MKVVLSVLTVSLLLLVMQLGGSSSDSRAFADDGGSLTSTNIAESSPCSAGGDDDAGSDEVSDDDAGPGSGAASDEPHVPADPDIEADDCPSDCGDQTAPGAYLFDLPDWGGECFYFNGTHPQLFGFDNRASSVRVIGSYELYGCFEPFFQPPCGGTVVTDPNQILNIGDGGFDNALSSVRIKPWVDHCILKTTPGLYLFSDVNYGGQCVYFGEDVPALGAMPPFYANDVFPSMQLVGWPEVELCAYENYQGYCKTFSNNDPDLSDDNLFFGQGNSDNVSSLRFPVSKTSLPPTATPVPATPAPATPSPATPALATPTPEPTTAVQASDANCDGAVNESDVLAVLTFAGGSGAGCTGAENAGDADCNGRVDAADATRILETLVGLADEAC